MITRLLVGLSLVAAATTSAWFVTLAHVRPVAPSWPRLEWEPVADEDNALVAIREAEPRLGLTGLTRATRRAIAAAATAPGAPPPAVARLVAAKAPAVAAALREAGRRPQVQLATGFTDPYPSYRELVPAHSLTRLGLLASRRRLRTPGAPDAVAPALDALRLGRRMSWTEGDALAVNLAGAAIVREVATGLRAERAALLARPTAELGPLAAELARLDALERPVARVMLGEREFVRAALHDAGQVGEDLAGMADMLEADALAWFDAMIAQAERAGVPATPRLPDRAALPGWVGLLHPLGVSAVAAAELVVADVADTGVKLRAAEAAFDGLRAELSAELARRER